MRKTVFSLLLLLLALPLAADDAKRRAIESNLATAVPIAGVAGKSLEQRMKELGVPAVSYAVVEDGKVVLAAAYGYADLEAKRRATRSTLFQAASISKPVTAMGVIDLVERGKLTLDAPVNTILRTWQLPENDLTAKTPVTLRLLLSHSAGTTVHGFPGYASGASRPTLAQVLEGKAPANTRAVTVDLAPNTKFRYSGGGTSVAQAAIVDHTGLPFAEFMRRNVLAPLGMNASTYQQPLPASRRNDAATAYSPGVRALDGKWHVYPEQAAAGLWTTPADLAKVIVELQNALAGKPAKLLSIDGARHMLTPRFPVDPASQVGLGFFVEDRGGARYFSHGGSNEGFRAVLRGTVDGSKGVVVMANSDTSSSLLAEIANTVAREYAFPGYPSEPLQTGSLSSADLDRFSGRYEIADNKQVVVIRRNGDRLESVDMTTGWQTLYPLADGKTLARPDRDTRYSLSADGLTVIARASTPQPRSLPAKRLAGDTPTADELFAAGEIDRALAAYREQFKTNPQSLQPQALYGAGFALLTAGQKEQALALLQLNTELHPSIARAWDGLAEGLMIAGETQRAIAATEAQLEKIEADTTVTDDIKAILKSIAAKRLQQLKKTRQRL